MTKKDLKTIFESEFSWESWRKVMDFVFPEFEFSSQKISIEKFTKAAEKRIQGFYQHGSLSLENNVTLSLFEAELKGSVNIPKNVKGIRKFIAEEAIANTQASIGVFHSDDKSKWRFTLAIKKLDDDLREKDHKPESFTYVFGKGEKGRTAADRFYKLSEKKEKTLKDLEDAFSVEALSKKFFNDYTAVYEDFVTSIVDNRSRLNLFKGSNQEKHARDFVKKMMGRIVFLYFLQKKGWMGCKGKWNEGKARFMLDLFKSAPEDELFYKNYLEELFFNVLNRKREDVDEDCIIAGTNYGKIPFLNGGLFEREDNHPENLTLDWNIFDRFFEILEAYNFTIIEDDPDYREVAVDPEMLGHIFENLLEDNKEKGAFYTPKEIVQYMCRESLIEYLNTKLSEKIKNDKLKEAIRTFVLEHAFSDLNNLDQNADRYVLEALRKIKVCDPAIGSGAFPMGILLEIYRMVEHFEYSDVFRSVWKMDAWDASRVKEEIIQNSIYGVDIEKGAVDIARLRFWLSIIIDEEEPKPLPNLDYKIVVGDSLLNKFEDHVIDIEWEIQEGTQTSPETLKYVQKRKELLEKISEKQKAYFDAESSKRNPLSQEIKDLKIDILINQLEMKVSNEGLSTEPKQQSFSKISNFGKAQQLYFQTLEWQDAINELNSIKETDKPFIHFDWKLDFPEILNPIINQNTAGFDLVIGNPPYDVYEGAKLNTLAFLKEKWIYSIAKGGKLNAYKLFIGKSIEVAKELGTFCLIFQNSFLADKEAVGVRKENIKNQRIIKLDSFPERDNKKKRVFESVKMSVCILLAHKEKLRNYEFELNVWKDKWMSKGYQTCYTKEEIETFDKDSYQFPMLKPGEKETFIKFYNKNPKIKQLGEVLTCYRGELNMTTQRPYFTSRKNRYMALKGAQIQKYIVSENMSQGVLEYVLKDKYIKENHGPKSQHFLEERCVTQRITGVNEKYRLKAALLPKNTFCADSCNYILGTIDYPKEVVMIFLNSNLYNWIFKKTSTNSNVNGYEIENLSIPVLNEDVKLYLIGLANKIISCKANGKSTLEHQRKADLIIYKLFELQYFEIIPVEPDFWLSKEEYNNLKLEEMV